MNVNEQTKVLKVHLHSLKQKFEKGEKPENPKDKALFSQVKKETAPVFQLLEHWERDVLQLIKTRKVNIHPQQIISTRENMELLLMHSYYLDVRRKRYMELNHSVSYILDQLLAELD
jgi:spore cortex formation protein SpoVR/YcgB (stage V sporulation)